MLVGDPSRLPVVQRARALIGAQLAAAGWVVQAKGQVSLLAAPGVAFREVVKTTGHGRVDSLLHADKPVVGVIEAEPEGTPLSGVGWQSANVVTCYAPGQDHTTRTEIERFHAFDDDLITRDKVNLGITWLRDGSLDDLATLPAPGVVAREVVEDLTAALAEFEAVAATLEARQEPPNA